MIEDYFFNKKTKWVLWGAFAFMLSLLVFHAGFVLGQHQPMHGRTGTINGMPPQGMFDGQLYNLLPRQGFMENGHGAVGTIATITLPTFLLESRDGLTQTVYAGSSTMVTGGRVADTSALMRGEVVVVLGDPADTDDGYLDARIIHILPASQKIK